MPTPRRLRRAAAAVVLLLAFAAAPRARAGAPAEWALAGGYYDLGHSQETWEAGIEARWRPYAIPLGGFELPIEPGVGAMVNGDDAGYGYVTFRIPLDRLWPDGWPQRLRVTPFTGVGWYERGDSKDLGGEVEFRSGLEVAVRAGRRTWVGLSFYHLSNAGIYDPNPGEESLTLVVSWR